MEQDTDKVKKQKITVPVEIKYFNERDDKIRWNAMSWSLKF